MPRAPHELLDLLARHHGMTAAPARPPRPEVARGARYDTADPDLLLGLHDDDLAARIEARLAADPEDPLPALRAELRAFAQRDGRCVPTGSLAAARHAVVAHARDETGRRAVIVFGGRTEGVDDPCTAIPFDRFEDAARAIDAAAGQLACLLLEPRGDAATLRDVAARAAAAGARVVLDESRTAGRIADGTVAAAEDVPCNALLLGPSLCGGLAFAAVLGDGAGEGLPPPDPATAEVALATASRLRSAPVRATLMAAGESVRERFARRSRQEEVRAELAGPPALLRLRFAGQENAEAPLIAHHFQLELRALGVHAEPDIAIPAGLCDTDVRALGDAFEGAVARIRTLLIEHNSYLSGGIPFVFDGGHERLRARGIARYRHPKLAAVDVEPVDGRRMRIAFARGELGPVTSSGFYLPTRLRGDFDIRVRYAVETWEPGPDSACLGLFVQNEPSTARYYAQLMSTVDRKGERSVAAGLAGELSGRREVPGRAGWLRLLREGDRVSAWHRDGDESEFVELGALQPCSRDDVITGVKIWSKVRCGGLVVELADLQVDAVVPEDQFPELEERPDPRAASGQGR